jgi:hypothetical protein
LEVPDLLQNALRTLSKSATSSAKERVCGCIPSVRAVLGEVNEACGGAADLDLTIERWLSDCTLRICRRNLADKRQASTKSQEDILVEFFDDEAHVLGCPSPATVSGGIHGQMLNLLLLFDAPESVVWLRYRS